MSNLLVQNIKHTNATTAQTIDSSGRITYPARPFISLKGNGAAEVTTAGSDDVFTFFDVVENSGITFNSSNGRITVPTTGLYLITAGFYVWANATGQNTIDLYINTTRSRVYSHETNSINSPRNDETITISEVQRLSATDYIYFSANADLYSDGLYIWCQVTFIG